MLLMLLLIFGKNVKHCPYVTKWPLKLGADLAEARCTVQLTCCGRESRIGL